LAAHVSADGDLDSTNEIGPVLGFYDKSDTATILANSYYFIFKNISKV